MIEALIVLALIIGLGVYSAVTCVQDKNEAGSIACLLLTGIALLLHTSVYL